MLNIEELAIIRMYKGEPQGRRAIIDVLKTVLPHFSEGEEDMRNLTQSTLRKLTAMTDQSFDAIDFSETITHEDLDME